MNKSTNQLLSVIKTHQYGNLNIKVQDRGFLKKTSNPLPKNKQKKNRKSLLQVILSAISNKKVVPQ